MKNVIWRKSIYLIILTYICHNVFKTLRCVDLEKFLWKKIEWKEMLENHDWFSHIQKRTVITMAPHPWCWAKLTFIAFLFLFLHSGFFVKMISRNFLKKFRKKFRENDFTKFSRKIKIIFTKNCTFSPFFSALCPLTS